MLVAAAQVYFRDLSNFLPYVLRIWLYVSPVLYYADEVPDRYKWILDVNPLGGLLTAWSDVLNAGQAPQAGVDAARPRLGRRAVRRRAACSSCPGSVSSLSVSERTAISVEDVSVTYRTSFERAPTLRSTMLRLGRRERVVREIEARASNVSFDVPARHRARRRRRQRRGQVDARCARSRASSRRARAASRSHGRVSTLLALGVGFNRELSGRENVVLGGLAAGLKREQLAEKYDDIVAFAELEDFMDMPMRTYSSGMYGRLGVLRRGQHGPGHPPDRRGAVGRRRALPPQVGATRCASCAARTAPSCSSRTRSARSRSSPTRRSGCDKGELRMWDEPEAVIDAYTEFLEVKQDAVTLEEM